jgi:HEAT repeat protein
MLGLFTRELEGCRTDNHADVSLVCVRAETLEKLGWHPAALAEYTAWKNSPLDRELGRILAEVAGKPEPRFREDLWVLFSLLARIGGVGLETAVTAWVNSSDPLSQGWMEYVSFVKNPAVTAGLRRRADSLLRVDSSPRKLPWDQAEALTLLAERFDHAKIIETVLRWGEEVIFAGLATAGEGGPVMSEMNIQPALEVLRSGQNLARRINAVYALGLSGRPEVPAIFRDLLEAEGFNTKLVVAVLEAQAMLNLRDDTLVPMLREYLKRKETAGPAARLLLGLESPEAAAALAESLLAGEPPAGPNFPWNVHSYLLRRPEWRQKILQQIWESQPKDSIKWFWFNAPIGRYLPEIGELHTREAEELLWSLAFPEHPPVHTVGQAAAAIKGLARIDPSEAFRAAELRFLEDEKDREYWIELVAELDPQRAAPLFLRQAEREQSTWGLWHIGLALGRLMEPSVLLAALQPMWDSGRPRTQIAAAEIAGWQHDAGFGLALVALLRRTTETEVVEAAHQALWRLGRSQLARQMAAVLPTLSGTQKWSYGEAWGNLSEPLFFTRKNRSHEVRQALDLLPEPLRKKLGRDLQRRLDDQKRKVEDEDRRSRQNAPRGE